MLNLAILVNWIKDESYILIEPNVAVPEGDQLTLEWQNPEGITGNITLQTKNKETMLEFATQVYEGINQGYQFHIKSGDMKIPVLVAQPDREAFRITMSDYYRLTRVF